MDKNKLIDDFMNKTRDYDYFDSWDSIMKIIDHIEKQNYDVIISSGGQCIILSLETGDIVIDTYERTKLEAVKKAIIEFINHLNQ